TDHLSEPLAEPTHGAVGRDRAQGDLRPRHAPQAPTGALVLASDVDRAALRARGLAAGARLRRRRARDLHVARAQVARARRSRPIARGAARNRTDPAVRLSADGAAV